MTVLHPNLMTSTQRIDEIAHILALGIVRLRMRTQPNNSLDLRAVRSMYASVDNTLGDIND